MLCLISVQFIECTYHLSRVMRKLDFCLGEKKEQISFAVTAKLISTFVFATPIVQFHFFLNLKFQVSYPSSVGAQAGFCQTWSETQIVCFVMHGLILCFVF